VKLRRRRLSKLPKYKLSVICNFEIEVEDDSENFAVENTILDTVENLLNYKTEDSIERIYVNKIDQV
jgi:hypothetical protein